MIAIPAQAEWYVAGQAGYSFADALRNVKGTGGFSGIEAHDFDLNNSLAYGGKIGVYPFHRSLGFELDVFHSTPHVKSLDDIPGVHLAVTNIGANIVLRYPGVTFQPYLGAGPAILIARLSRSAETQQDTQVSIGFNFLTGIRAFVTPKVALFTEYKYTDGSLALAGAFGSFGGFEVRIGRTNYFRRLLSFLREGAMVDSMDKDHNRWGVAVKPHGLRRVAASDSTDDHAQSGSENGYAGVYDPATPYYSSPGFWWSPFGYYPGFSGYGPGYRSGYPYYYPHSGFSSGRPSSGFNGPSSRPTPPANAPSRMFIKALDEIEGAHRWLFIDIFLKACVRVTPSRG